MNQSAALTADLFGEGDEKRRSRRGAFGDNMKLPGHRWFRYSAGFSADWVKSIIEDQAERPRLVLDPFAGSGTTLLACQQSNAPSAGFEAQPFVARVAMSKLAWTSSPTDFYAAAQAVLENAKSLIRKEYAGAAPLLEKCFSPKALSDLNALRQAFESTTFSNEDVRALVWLAITSIIRSTSCVGTAQWQYVLPKKERKGKIKTPFDTYTACIAGMHADMVEAAPRNPSPGHLYNHDARNICPNLGRSSVDLVITSPPYPNNYDYADATRLEMSFWGEIKSWGELHKSVRRHLLTSCSQHSAAEKMQLDELLSSRLIDPIRAEITEVGRRLAEQRTIRPGKKTYDTMVVAYFRDLARVWNTLRFHMAEGGVAYFVMGDSAPYGVHVPAERWLGELALASGFHSWEFEKLRDRNVKWKNRKHRVPLFEGVIKVQG